MATLTVGADTPSIIDPDDQVRAGGFLPREEATQTFAPISDPPPAYVQMMQSIAAAGGAGGGGTVTSDFPTLDVAQAFSVGAQATVAFGGAPGAVLPIPVTGNWGDGTAQASLLSALTQLGIITDQTVSSAAGAAAVYDFGSDTTSAGSVYDFGSGTSVPLTIQEF